MVGFLILQRISAEQATPAKTGLIDKLHIL